MNTNAMFSIRTKQMFVGLYDVEMYAHSPIPKKNRRTKQTYVSQKVCMLKVFFFKKKNNKRGINNTYTYIQLPTIVRVTVVHSYMIALYGNLFLREGIGHTDLQSYEPTALHLLHMITLIAYGCRIYLFAMVLLHLSLGLCILWHGLIGYN